MGEFMDDQNRNSGQHNSNLHQQNPFSDHNQLGVLRHQQNQPQNQQDSSQSAYARVSLFKIKFVYMYL